MFKLNPRGRGGESAAASTFPAASARQEKTRNLRPSC